MQIWAESGKSALPICNYSQILYQFLTFTQNLKRSHHEPCDYYQFGNKLTGGMRSCFREQSQFCVLCHTEKKKTPGNTIRYFLCL